jgi:hypothetical protein
VPATAAIHGVLQRCGPVPCSCPDRDDSGSLLNRYAVGPQPTNMADVPAIVHDVLRSPGQPLATDVRPFYESRFNHDFSRVRVHTDARATESARAVDATAYTVGQHVVFAAGAWAPQSRLGSKLLAHELAHTIQQRGTSTSGLQPLTVSHPSDSSERSADLAAQRISAGSGPVAVAARSAEIARQTAPPRDAGAVGSGREQPDAGVEPPRDHEQEPLSKAEMVAVDAHLVKAGLAADVPATIQAPTVLLHDTSASITAKAISKQQGLGRGPLGGGVAAYVPAADPPQLARQRFFETRRPSTTEFEKDIQAFAEPGDDKMAMAKRAATWKERRDKLFRDVWNATRNEAQDAAVGKSVDALRESEKTEQVEGNKKKGEEHITGLASELKPGSTDKVMTAASWAVDEVCRRVAAEGTKDIAVRAEPPKDSARDKPAAPQEPKPDPAKEAELASACKRLSNYFDTRRRRIESIVPIEIVQPGVLSQKGSQDTCDPKNKNIAPLADPEVYSSQQYNSVVALYLRAARAAGKFPTITTHFAVDAFLQGHCDPRCFNLWELYGRIASVLGHGAGSRYGIEPKYGTKWGTHNVWWDNGICHGSPPAATPSVSPKSQAKPVSK